MAAAVALQDVFTGFAPAGYDGVIETRPAAAQALAPPGQADGPTQVWDDQTGGWKAPLLSLSADAAAAARSGGRSSGRA